VKTGQPVKGIERWFPRSGSARLDLIERPGRFTRRKAARRKDHPTIAAFLGAVQDVSERVPTPYKATRPGCPAVSGSLSVMPW